MKAETTRRPLLPACASALRIKCTRQRWQLALSTLATVAFALVGVGHDQLYAAQAAARELAHERGPERLGLGRADVHAENLPFRLVLHDKPAVPGPPAVVGEAEEGEGLGSPLAVPLTREGRKPTKLDQPRLALMKHQAKAGQPRLEGQEHLLRIRLALEAHDEVVRIAHGHNATACRRRRH